MPKRELPLLLRYREAARELSLCERYVHELANKGLLERIKIGPKVARVTSASVLKLATQRNPTEDAA